MSIYSYTLHIHTLFTIYITIIHLPKPKDKLQTQIFRGLQLSTLTFLKNNVNPLKPDDINQCNH